MAQREEQGQIVIYCDYTGTDWDGVCPMIEGHQGSVLSLEALEMAIEGATDAIDTVTCTMCLREVKPPDKIWRHPAPPPAANPQAVICWDCIQQADRAFARDPDTAWDRHIQPSKRWS